MQFHIDQLKDLSNQKIVIKEDQIKDYYKLDNLVNCEVQILGKMKTLYLNNLKECKIITGVVETSIFGDHIENSTIKAIAQQIRIHKSRNSQFEIFVTSSMIIEDCSQLSIRELAIPEEVQVFFNDSQLAQRENNWKEIKDFNWIKNTPSPNFSLA